MSSTALTVKTAYHQGTDLVEVPEFDPANYRDFYLKRRRKEQQRKLANQQKEKEKANKKNVILRIERNNRFITAIKTVTFLAAKFHFYHQKKPIPQQGCPCPRCTEFKEVQKDFRESMIFMVNNPKPPQRNKLELVKNFVCNKYKISWGEIASNRRNRYIVQARQEFFRIAKVRTNASYPRMAKFCGGRDHTTALHGVKKYAAEYAKIQEFGSERYLKKFKSPYLRPDDVMSDSKIMMLELEDRRF